MKQYARWAGMLCGAAAVMVATQPAWAAPTQVTAVRINQTNAGIEMMLETKGGKRPQVFAVPNGNSWMADIINTQLRLPDGTSFSQDNPAPGIALVTVKQQNANSIRVTVTGKNGPIIGGAIDSGAAGLTFSIKSQTIVAQSTTPTATPRPQVTSAMPSGWRATRRTPGRASPVQLPRLQNGSPVWPQAQNVAPPKRPRAIAPPVGDISVSTIDSSTSTINLGSNEVVRGLELRDAPVKEVLALLAREAGFNLAFSTEDEESQAQGSEEASKGQTITMYVENESVQDVFNNILRVTGLEANRIGRTIFVGKKLPIAASQIVTRTLRLNQVLVGNAAAFLAIQGADSQQVITETIRTTEGEGVERVVRSKTRRVIEPLSAREGMGALLLKGLSVVTDDRLNAITLIGEARKVEIATALLTQQDLRRRQAAVNVKIIDVNLSATDNFNSSFSFGIGDSFFVVDGGQGVANFGRLTPPSAEDTTLNRFGRPILPNPLTQQPFEDDGPRLFLNPDGTQQIRDPASGQFLSVGPNQAGSIFSPGGVPTTPGITGITPQQLPSGASAPLYLDAQGIPRPANELTIGGGNIAPFISPEGDLIQARAFRVGTTGTAGVPQQFFDFQGNPRLPSELANPGNIEGFTGSIQPLLNPNGNPVTAVTGVAGNAGVSTSSPLFFDINGIPRTLSQLTLAGGSFQPLFEESELIQVGTQATGLIPFIGRAAQFAFGLPEAFQYPQQFLAQLQASVVENNAKILTDPTLTVQEGETGRVNLTQRVPIDVKITRERTEAGTTTDIDREFEDVGLVLPISIQRIDDNGFITLNVVPNVSTIVGSTIIDTGEGEQQIFLTAKREMNSGTIRLRDGQTLILAGIIQEQDRELVRKIPILGDLPIVGSLFRSRDSEDIRNEVVIVITPRIIEDTERSNFGYGYRPGPGVQQIMP